MSIKYDVILYGLADDSEEHDHFDLVRIDRPSIIDKAGRKQWQKEAGAEVRTVILKDLPITELGALLNAVAYAASHYVHGKEE